MEKEVTYMEIKPLAQAPFYAPPAPAPYPVMPVAPAPPPMKPHDHIHLHASYKHTAIVMPPVPQHVHHVHYAHHAPVARPFTSTASILVLFILLAIISRSVWC
jgi:hypothetical protein